MCPSAHAIRFKLCRFETGIIGRSLLKLPPAGQCILPEKLWRRFDELSPTSLPLIQHCEEFANREQFEVGDEICSPIVAGLFSTPKEEILVPGAIVGF